MTSDPYINVARVESRVMGGGHGVPKEKVIVRYEKALGLVKDLIPVCDVCHIVRILTLPPIVIGITVLLMYVPAKLMTLRELLLCELFLLLIPMAAYPIREIFHIGKDRRKGQRSTALVCSAIGYICGFLWSMLTPCSWLVHILFLSYVISIAALLILNAVFKLHASGHACSTTAPAFLLTWKLHPLFIIPSVLLIAAVYRSSLKLSRHTPPQLLIGSAVSLLACGISLLTYGLG